MPKGQELTPEKRSWIELIGRRYNSVRAQMSLTPGQTDSDPETSQLRADLLRRIDEGSRVINDLLQHPDNKPFTLPQSTSRPVTRNLPYFNRDRLDVDVEVNTVYIKSVHAFLAPPADELPLCSEHPVTVVEVSIFDIDPKSGIQVEENMAGLIEGRRTVTERRSAASAARVRENIDRAIGAYARLFITRADMAVGTSCMVPVDDCPNECENSGGVGKLIKRSGDDEQAILDSGYKFVPVTRRLFNVRLQQMGSGEIENEAHNYVGNLFGVPEKIEWAKIKNPSPKNQTALDAVIDGVHSAILRQSRSNR